MFFKNKDNETKKDFFNILFNPKKNHSQLQGTMAMNASKTFDIAELIEKFEKTCYVKVLDIHGIKNEQSFIYKITNEKKYSASKVFIFLKDQNLTLIDDRISNAEFCVSFLIKE